MKRRINALKKTSMDLTRGSIVRLITVFTLPMLLGQIFQNLYNSADSIIVGQFVGTTALAAVTSCSDISHLLVGFFNGLSIGAGVLFSRHFGAKEYDRLRDSIHTSVFFCLILGVVMTCAGIFLTPVLLRAVSCPEDVYRQSASYLRIYFVGVMFTSLYNVGSGVLRAVGDSRSPFVYLVIASVLNILLDLLFVGVLHMDVEGVAWATIISQCVSTVLVFRRLMTSQDVYRLSLRHMRIDKKILWQVIDLGLPTAVQASLLAISNLFVQRYVNYFGSSAMAGIGAAKKIDKFVGLISQSLGWCSTTFVSQNLGAGRRDRAMRGIRACLLLGFAAVAVTGVPVYYFAPFFLRFFTKDAAALSYGAAMVHCMMPLYYFQTLNQVFAGSVRGFGRSRAVMVLSLIGMVVMRQIFLAVSMSINHTVTNVYYGYPLGWAFSAIFVMIYYVIVLRKEKSAALPA